MNALIKIKAGDEETAEYIAKLLINEANSENRIIAVGRTRKKFGYFEKKVAFGRVRKEIKSN